MAQSTSGGPLTLCRHEQGRNIRGEPSRLLWLSSTQLERPAPDRPGNGEGHGVRLFRITTTGSGLRSGGACEGSTVVGFLGTCSPQTPVAFTAMRLARCPILASDRRSSDRACSASRAAHFARSSARWGATATFTASTSYTKRPLAV